MKLLLTLILVFAYDLSGGVERPLSSPDALLGAWLNPPGTRKVEFSKDSNVYVGKLVWISPSDENPGKLNAIVFKNMQWNGQAFVGTAITPKQDEVACNMLLETDQKLKITFTKGMFSKSMVWTRAHADQN